MKLDITKMSVFFHNNRNYDAHFLMTAADLAKHGRVSAIPKSSEQFISFTVGNLIFKDSMQFMGRSLDELVKDMEKDDLKITKEFLRNYVKDIKTNPKLLDDETLGLYKKEVPDESYEIATEEKRNLGKKKKKNPNPNNPKPNNQSSSNRNKPNNPPNSNPNNRFLDHNSKGDDDGTLCTAFSTPKLPLKTMLTAMTTNTLRKKRNSIENSSTTTMTTMNFHGMALLLEV